jgi:hypothetical protein
LEEEPTTRLVVVGVIVRISIFLPTLFPLLQPDWGPQADRVGIVKLTKLARAILEARCVVPISIGLVSKLLNTVL